MGRYQVRYKGAPIKGVSKGLPADNEDEEEDAVAEATGKQKMKIGTPEKDVVAAVLGVSKSKKKEVMGTVVTDEKGSAKSGNYGHAGRPGKLGGSAPKRSQAGVTRVRPENPLHILTGDTGKLKHSVGVQKPSTTGKPAAAPAKAPTTGTASFGFNKPVDNARDARVAEAKDKLLNTYKKIPGATMNVPKRGHSIMFDDTGYTYLKMAGGDNKHIEAALKKVETALGRQLPRDPKTDFPGFTIFQNGEEIGGG